MTGRDADGQIRACNPQCAEEIQEWNMPCLRCPRRAGKSETGATWREERETDGYYRIHRDGRVVAYARETQSNWPNRWRATAWTADPRTNPDASYDNLCADATWNELSAHLSKWEDPTQ